MPLFTCSDIESERNIDLSSPDGQNIATSIIAAVVAWASSRSGVGFPIESGSVTEYFDEGHCKLFLYTTAPVSGITVYTLAAYDAVSSGLVRNAGSRVVYVDQFLPDGFQAVRVANTTGWTAETLR